MPFNIGDTVQWFHGRNVCVGKIKDLLKEPIMVNEREIHVSLKDPTYVISTTSGRTVYHHSSALQFVKEQKKEGDKGVFLEGEVVNFQVGKNQCEGTIIRQLDDMEKLGEIHVHASHMDPQYLIKTSKGKEIHHHFSALNKMGGGTSETSSSTTTA